MSFKYFRFYLSESQIHEKEALEEVFGLSHESGLRFNRKSFDLTSTDTSISILCESEEDIEIEKDKWRDFLQSKGVALKRIEHELLQDEERFKVICAHAQNCSHDHHDHHDHHKHDKKHKNHNHDKHKNNHKNHNHHSHDKHDDHHDYHKLKAGIGLVCGIGLLVLSVASFNIPLIAYYIITGFSTLVTLFLGYKVYQSAWHSLMKKKWDMSTLYTISTLAIIGISIAGLFVPGLPMMLESAPLILGFWHLGEAIEHTLLNKINKKLDIRDCVSQTALLKEDVARDVSVKQLIPNDIIIIKSGEVIPVDGVLTQSASLYTTRVDGSPYLKRFNPGDAVKAGMTLADHQPQSELRVTKTYQNSYLSLIAKNINKAIDNKAPVELFANKILKYFVPGLLTVALISGVIMGLLFPPALAIQCVISVLVSACPCVLSMITPMAVRIGMKKASEQGAHFKDGKTLQSASDIDTVVFDLNGTLTLGEVSVKTIRMEDKNKQFLKHFKLLEEQSTHQVAETIRNYIEKQEVVVDESLEITAVDTSHHSGIKGTISGETFMIGNRDMLLANGVETISSPYDDVKNGTIYMVRDQEVIGQIALTDPLRHDALATVKQLQSMGKTIHICTGDYRSTAEQYAQVLGIPNDNICANTVGAAASNDEVSKESYIRLLQRKGHKVSMVGDSANDLTAIICADVGIAVKSKICYKGTQEKAGMVVQKGLLFPIAMAFDVASKTKRNIFQNLFVSLTYNSMITLVAAGLFVVLGFALNPAIGVALMIAESTIVLANLYRLKHQKTVTLISNQKSKCETGPSNETTSKVLNGLGFRPKSSLEHQASSKEDLMEYSFGSAPSGQCQFLGDGNKKATHSTQRNHCKSCSWF